MNEKKQACATPQSAASSIWLTGHTAEPVAQPVELSLEEIKAVAGGPEIKAGSSNYEPVDIFLQPT